MSLPPTQRVPQPSTPTQNAPAEVPFISAKPKDLSLVSLVPKWSGSDTALPIQEFFEIIEDSAKLGSWSEADQILVCALKLTDAARAYYSVTPELRDPAITWQAFKAHFLKRFRDVRGDQYHFTQLQMARQRKEETPAEFLDRCRLLARRTVPCTTDPVLQRAYNKQAERMLLAAFIAGLQGVPGRQTRFSLPGTTEEAWLIAETVTQAEIQEVKNNAFYMDSEAAEISPAGRTRVLRRESTGNAQTDVVQCYECQGFGHYARHCANRFQRRADSNASEENGRETGQGEPSKPSPRDRAKTVDGLRANKAPLKGKDGRRDSASNLLSPEVAVNSLQIALDNLNGAPSIRVVVDGCPRIFLIDTGSSLSLIQPGVCSTQIDHATVIPYGVTGDELQVKGEQLVHFKIGGERYSHNFCVCTLSTEADAILGMDFLRAMDAELDLKGGKLWLEKARERKQSESHGNAVRATLTVFSATDGRAKQNSCTSGYRKKPEKSRNPEKESKRGKRILKSKTRQVNPRQTNPISPRVKQMAVGRVEFPKCQETQNKRKKSGRRDVYAVEHRPGTQIRHAVALSRAVQSVAQDRTLPREEVKAEQAKDRFCQSLEVGRAGSESEYFADKDGVIYRRRKGGEHQLIVPSCMTARVIALNHDPVTVIHPDRSRTIDILCLQYYWPRMRRDVENYIKNCHDCQRLKPRLELHAFRSRDQARKAHTDAKRSNSKSAKERKFSVGDFMCLHSPRGWQEPRKGKLRPKRRQPAEEEKREVISPGPIATRAPLVENREPNPARDRQVVDTPTVGPSLREAPENATQE